MLGAFPPHWSKDYDLYFHPASGQVTTISLPLYLRAEGIKGEKGDGPYRELSITITLRSPCITFYPPQILLTPVPLESEVTATLTLLALGYPRLVYTYTPTQISESFFVNTSPLT